LYSLGVLCYNDGANILKKATPLANSDADKYAAEKEKVIYCSGCYLAGKSKLMAILFFDKHVHA